jgi:hypothetical protein
MLLLMVRPFVTARLTVAVWPTLMLTSVRVLATARTIEAVCAIDDAMPTGQLSGSPVVFAQARRTGDGATYARPRPLIAL